MAAVNENAEGHLNAAFAGVEALSDDELLIFSNSLLTSIHLMYQDVVRGDAPPGTEPTIGVAIMFAGFATTRALHRRDVEVDRTPAVEAIVKSILSMIGAQLGFDQTDVDLAIAHKEFEDHARWMES